MQWREATARATWRLAAISLRAAIFILLLLAGLIVVLITALPSPASTQAPLCAESAQQAEAARKLVQQGLERALVEHTARLFRVWLSVGVEGRLRAAEGIRNEIRGYLYAQHVVGEWVIPLCKGN